jgi:hypothetical protein
MQSVCRRALLEQYAVEVPSLLGEEFIRAVWR